MKKLTKNEVIAVVIGLVLVTGFILFGSLGFIPFSLSFNNQQDTFMNTALPGSSEENTDQIVQKEATSTTLLSQDTVVGTGAEAVAGKQVTVHYRGTLLNGAQFDASYDRGTPFSFTLGAGEVIVGWDQGVSGMKVGGKRKLVIPPTLAYGDRDLGVIPPNSTLVFEVELLDVK